MNKRSFLAKILFVIILISLLYVVVKNLGEIIKYDFTFRWEFIFLALVAETVAFIFQFIIWVAIAKEYGLEAPHSRAARAFFVSQLGKYIPGKFGLILIRMEAYRDFSRKQAAIATAFEMVASLASACLLVLLGILSISTALPPYVLWGAFAGIAVFLVVLYPPFFRKVMNFGMKLIKRQPIEMTASYPMTLKFIMAFILVAMLHGLGLFTVMFSLSPMPLSYYLTVTSVYYAAGLVGFFAVFAPAGIGVREGLMILVLPAIIDKPVVIISAILIRLVMTAAELILAGLSVLIERLSHDSGNRNITK